MADQCPAIKVSYHSILHDKEYIGFSACGAAGASYGMAIRLEGPTGYVWQTSQYGLALTDQLKLVGTLFQSRAIPPGAYKFEFDLTDAGTNLVVASWDEPFTV